MSSSGARIRILTVALLLCATGASAQRDQGFLFVDLPPQDRARKPMSDAQVFLRFEQLIEGGQSTQKLVSVLGEKHGNRANYQSTVFISTATSCTAAVIGPHALLTAQHCVIGSGPIRLSVKSGVVRAWCVKYLNYSEITSQDLALCWIEKAMDPPFETLAFASDLVQLDTTLALAGYGLTGKEGSTVGKEFGLGMAQVADPGPETIKTSGQAKVRIGDSGGPGYVITKDKSRRLLVAVTKQESLQDAITSFLTGLSFQHAKDFIEWWPRHQMKTFGRTVAICGIDTILGCQ